jgi:uncharacterized protein (TIGR03083 family)
VIDLEADPRTPFLRQRRRLRVVFEGLTEDDWRTPSRCEGWTAQDVASHLATVDGFWLASIEAGRTGDPSRFLVGFDPKATPAMLVDAGRAKEPTDTLVDVVAAMEALCAAVEAMAADDLETLAEAPPGHVAIRALLHHALWDSWVHERDVCLPLGRTPDVEPDEVIAALSYVAGLSPAFAVMAGTGRADALVLDVTEPRATLVVEADAEEVRVRQGAAPEGALRLTGTGVELVERLSLRTGAGADDVPSDRRWLLAGLAEAFA